MSDYTPTTEQVRDFWASGGRYQPAAKSYDYDESTAEFNRWLRQVKAEAWDEADAAILAHIGRHGTSAAGWPTNPY